MGIIKKPIDYDFIKRWSSKGIDPIVLSILNRRGLNSDGDVLRFMYPELELLLSPFVYADAAKAYQRIELAVKNSEKIIIFGDRDVDGVTSTYIMYDFLCSLGAKVDCCVPVGDESYGLTESKINEFKGKYSLCITVDCGITNTHEVKLLGEYGIETIIIDHHHLLDKQPDAHSIINPKLLKIKNNDIAACGVVLLFISGYAFYKSGYFDKVVKVEYKSSGNTAPFYYKNLMQVELKSEEKADIVVEINDESQPAHLDRDMFSGEIELFVRIKSFYKILTGVDGYYETFKKYAQYCALGLIADIMPLVETNRILVKYGLSEINHNPHPQLRNLIESIGLDYKNITSTDIAWKICPVLNSPGRMGNALEALNFFIKNDYQVAGLINSNEDRKKFGTDGYNLFISEIDENKKLYGDKINFFYSDKISRGVLSLTASKLCEVSGCPVIVAYADQSEVVGSIRSRNDIHLVEFLDGAKEILAEYGGHKNAAGFRFNPSRLDDFKRYLEAKSSDIELNVNDDTEIDAEIPVDYLEYSLYKNLKRLEPYGMENQNPVLYTKSISIFDYVFMGKNKEHLKVVFSGKGDMPISGLYWNKAEWFKSNCSVTDKFDILYNIEINNYKGKVTMQLKIIDMFKCE